MPKGYPQYNQVKRHSGRVVEVFATALFSGSSVTLIKGDGVQGIQRLSQGTYVLTASVPGVQASPYEFRVTSLNVTGAMAQAAWHPLTQNIQSDPPTFTFTHVTSSAGSLINPSTATTGSMKFSYE